MSNTIIFFRRSYIKKQHEITAQSQATDKASVGE